MNELPAQIRRACKALDELRAALRPRTEAEYWQWLRHNDPLRYIIEQRAVDKARSTADCRKR